MLLSSVPTSRFVFLILHKMLKGLSAFQEFSFLRADSGAVWTYPFLQDFGRKQKQCVQRVIFWVLYEAQLIKIIKMSIPGLLH